MSGQQIKERLERDLGFETNRARLLAEETAANEISIYWKGKSFQAQDNQIFTTLAKASLVAGLAGRQKLTDLLFKILTTLPEGIEISDVANEITALVLDHQATLNSSRHRASCINAHLNILEPDRALVQIYSAHLSDSEVKKAKKESYDLLKAEISSEQQFTAWLGNVHNLLSRISDDPKTEDGSDDGTNESGPKKGIISRKAISTYQKQWELFTQEKIGTTFGMTLQEENISPLSSKLNKLEKGTSRSWTTIVSDITEMKTSSAYQRRVSTPTERGFTASSAAKNLDNYELDLNGRPLQIQLSSSGVTRDNVGQFSKAMRAQFLVYPGKGLFSVSSNSSGKFIAVSVPNVTKSDLKKIEEVLSQLI
ncbi:MAG: hypothetical protein WCO95_01465 [Actinomycetes bacterium]